MRDISYLTVSTAFAKELQKAGIAQISALHVYTASAEYPTSQAMSDELEKEYVGILPDNYKGAKISAFTVMELDIMLGNRWERPRLPELRHITRATEPFHYQNNYLDTQRSFKNMADAYADLILRLIQDDQLNVQEVNHRLSRVFPQFI